MIKYYKHSQVFSVEEVLGFQTPGSLISKLQKVTQEQPFAYRDMRLRGV